MQFIVKNPDGADVNVYPKKQISDADFMFLWNDRSVTADTDNPDNDPEWMYVIDDLTAGSPTVIEGWVQRKFLVEPVFMPGERPVFGENQMAPFVRSCARAEIDTDTGSGEDGQTIVADYLIAWADLESNFTNPAPFSESFDGEGPFRITSAQWERYAEAANRADLEHPIVIDEERAIPLFQVPAAAMLAQNYADEYSNLATSNPAPKDGRFIPSYLNIYHCHILGVEAAYKFQKLKDEGQASKKVDEVLVEVIGDVAKVENILNYYSKYLKHEDSPKDILGFYAKTGEDMNKALGAAYSKIRKYCIDKFGKNYMIPQKSEIFGVFPWMVTADEELALWNKPGDEFDESSQIGKSKIIEYFASIGVADDGSSAWCGAFVGHCLKKAGPPHDTTIVKTPERAENWLNWGSVRLRLHHQGDIPRGSIVVLHPQASGSSGHVAFFDRKIENQKVALLGGNQGKYKKGTVSISHEKKTKIREIRCFRELLPSSEPVDNSSQPGAIIDATKHDVLILARTLYGEARSESQKGIEAVANVILNRLKTNRWGDKISNVCLARKQFSCWNTNDRNFQKIRSLKLNANEDIIKCHEIALRAVKGELENHFSNDNNHETLHYHTRSVAPDWVKKGHDPVVTAKLGAHIFWKGIDS